MGFFQRPQNQGPFYNHRLAPAADINGGAEEFVFERKWHDPVQLYTGIARLAGQFFATAKPVVVLNAANPPSDILELSTGSYYVQEAGELENNS
jgi:hypothetical protein